MEAPHLSADEAVALAKSLRAADDGNLLVGSFAAELVGESYPFSKAMSAIAFQSFTDEQLGRKFAKWMDDTDAFKATCQAIGEVAGQ